MNQSVSRIYINEYRIAGNFRGVNIRYFRGQAALHENVGMVYRKACNAMQAMTCFTHENHLLYGT